MNDEIWQRLLTLESRDGIDKAFTKIHGRTLNAKRSKEISEARSHAQDTVDCPECGASTSPLSIVSWGHCRACRTAQSREMYPLRW